LERKEKPPPPQKRVEHFLRRKENAILVEGRKGGDWLKTPEGKGESAFFLGGKGVPSLSCQGKKDNIWRRNSDPFPFKGKKREES